MLDAGCWMRAGWGEARLNHRRRQNSSSAVDQRTALHFRGRPLIDEQTATPSMDKTTRTRPRCFGAWCVVAPDCFCDAVLARFLLIIPARQRYSHRSRSVTPSRSAIAAQGGASVLEILHELVADDLFEVAPR